MSVRHGHSAPAATLAVEASRLDAVLRASMPVAIDERGSAAIASQAEAMQYPDLSALSLLPDAIDANGAIDKQAKKNKLAAAMKQKLAEAKTYEPKPKRPKDVITLKAPSADAERDYQVHLQQEGWVVVPTALAVDEELRRTTQNGFFEHFRTSPEFKDPDPSDPGWQPVLGGFAATGNPSSFHHPWVREVREKMEAVILDKDVLPLNGRKLEKCFDRMMYRITGETPTAESMHRDEALTAKDGDDIFGGWINLEDEDQFFSCVPRSHTVVGGKNKGFAKIPPAEWPKYWPDFRRVQIPKGYMLVFYERLVHEVLATPAPRRMIRMFLGWRVTAYDEPLFGTTQTLKWINDQGVPKIKSGQDPTVVPVSYPNFSARWPKFTTWSKRTFQDVCLYKHTVGGEGKFAGQVWTRVKPKMDSLREYGLSLHPAYEQTQVNQMFPHRVVWLYTFDSPGERVCFKLPEAVSYIGYIGAQETANIMNTVARRPKPWRVTDE